MIIHVALDESEWPANLQRQSRVLKNGSVLPTLGLRGGVYYIPDDVWAREVDRVGSMYIQAAEVLGMLRIEPDSSLDRYIEKQSKKRTKTTEEEEV